MLPPAVGSYRSAALACRTQERTVAVRTAFRRSPPRRLRQRQLLRDGDGGQVSWSERRERTYSEAMLLLCEASREEAELLDTARRRPQQSTTPARQLSRPETKRPCIRLRHFVRNR